MDAHPRLGIAAASVACVLLLAACDHFTASAGAPPAATPQLTPAAAIPVPSGCGDVGTADPLAVVDLLHREDGGCVPAAEAVVARCDVSLDPIALLGLAGEPDRYLGGSFAVPVASVPVGATSLGITAAGRFWILPGDQPSLYVESSAGVSRWLPVPRARDLDRPPTVTMIGDSILDGAAPDLTEQLNEWTLAIDAVVGRGSFDAAAVAESLPVPAPDAVVVEIGVNDHDPAAFAANLERILAATAEADLVVWVTAHGPDVAVPSVNEAIVAGMGALPDGAIADWDRWVPEASLSSDGVHPDTGNGALLADLLVPMLSAWRQAVWGGGPARCEGAVAAAVVG
ncbi:MAG TPA: hypothetical protein VF235_01565 [Actinomycetota bacterium]